MFELGVGQTISEVAVIGEQEQSGGIDVQPANREKAEFLIAGGQNIQDGRPAFFVAGGGNDAGGFMEHQADDFVGL
jgi:hypothetical protein